MALLRTLTILLATAAVLCALSIPVQQRVKRSGSVENDCGNVSVTSNGIRAPFEVFNTRCQNISSFKDETAISLNKPGCSYRLERFSEPGCIGESKLSDLHLNFTHSIARLNELKDRTPVCAFQLVKRLNDVAQVNVTFWLPGAHSLIVNNTDCYNLCVGKINTLNPHMVELHHSKTTTVANDHAVQLYSSNCSHGKMVNNADGTTATVEHGENLVKLTQTQLVQSYMIDIL